MFDRSADVLAGHRRGWSVVLFKHWLHRPFIHSSGCRHWSNPHKWKKTADRSEAGHDVSEREGITLRQVPM